MKVKLLLKKNCQTKMMLLKILKNHTGFGLKDSKDICDRLHELPYRPVEFLLDPPVDILPNEYVKSFREELSEMGLEFDMSGGTEFERNRKLLSLGIGDKEDYVSFLEENLIDQKELLNLVLNKLSKDDLKEIFGKIKTKI
jgi:hypothetical protein